MTIAAVGEPSIAARITLAFGSRGTSFPATRTSAAAGLGPAGPVLVGAVLAGASTIVIGAPTHGGLPALMDGSASREIWRHTRSNVLVVNPDGPGAAGDRSADAELLRG